MSMGAKIGAGFAVGMIIIAAIGASAYLSTQHLLEANRWVTHTHQVIEGLENVSSALTDAETGQRGFILTGEDRYLEPYDAATGLVRRDIDALVDLTRDNPAQQQSLHQVRTLADAKLAELRETIQLRRKSGLAAALPVVLADRGKKIMDDLRGVVAEMTTREQRLLAERNAAADTAAGRTIWTIVVWMPIALLVLAVAAVVLMRTVRFGGPALPAGPRGWAWGDVAVRYGSAVVIVAVALLLRVRLADAFGPLPLFIMVYPAVLLVASIGGGGPGILATLLSALAVDYWFLAPYGQFSVGAPNDVLALGIFTGSGLFLSVLAERLRRARWAEAVSVVQERQLDELSRLNEELSQQSEELSQQTEELSQQSEELAQQNEELQTQSEEIQSLNTELTHREHMLQKLVDAARLSTAERTVLQDVCAAAKEMFGPAASTVMVLEPLDGRLALRAQAGLGPEGAKVESLPATNCFVELVLAENKTAALADAALRSDLALVHPPGEQPFQAVLAAPMRIAERPFAVVGVFSRQKQDWTAEQFRLADWLAAQCARILETLRLQEQLRKAEEENRFLADLLENSDQPFGVGQPDGALRHTNRAFERLVGYSREELRSIDWVQKLTPPEWREIERARLEELHRTGEPVRYEKEYVRKDGSRVPIELFVHLVKDEQGQPHYYYSFITDIADRKRAEEDQARLAAIVESTDAAILSKDLHGIIKTWNAGATRLFGYCAEEVVGRPITLLLPPERVHEEEQILERLLGGHRVEHLETRRLTKDGRQIDVSVTVSPVRDRAGRIVGASKILRDITDRKRAEEELKAAKDSAESAKAAAEQANRAKDHFLAVLSHELRTPLTPVVMGLSMLQDRPDLDPATRETLEMVHRHVQMEARLVDDLLDVSRIARGKVELRKSAFELCTILQRTVEVCMPDIEARRLHFGLDLGPAAPYWIKADAARLQQVFWNLLKNAIKFTPHGGCVGIRCRPDHEYVDVEVNDTGIGIEPEALARVFTAFEQADRSITQQFGGLGLGLAISKALVELHGGQIRARSEGRDKGATFCVRLPLTAPAGAPEAPAPAATPSRGVRPLRVLLVEDHGVTAKMMRMVLTMDGHLVESAGDVASALELAGQQAFDLLVSDLGLPDGSGHDLLRQLRQRGHAFPGIALSGYGQEEDILRSREAGFTAHLTKPASREALVEAIASVMAAERITTVEPTAEPPASPGADDRPR